jgi:RNA polymerase primary sigma factor
MKELIEEQKHENTAHEELIARINVLQKVSQVLSEELKREPTVTELAAKMKMTEDEIQDIMKETLAAMSVSPDAEAAEEGENMDDLEDFASVINSNTDSKYES